MIKPDRSGAYKTSRTERISPRIEVLGPGDVVTVGRCYAVPLPSSA
jgi:hypothetical protein